MYAGYDALAGFEPAWNGSAASGRGGDPVTEQYNRTTFLQTRGLFAELGPGDAEALLAVGEAVSFPAGEPIFELGDHGDAMYVILSGEARVDVGGRFHVLRAGDFFGEMALLAPGKRMATVRAENDIRALRISAERFREFLAQRPGVALSMMKVLVLRLREVEQRIDAWMA
jgi:CRP/FNR family transcriptional regulator, cyclic AMP receptor protein